MARIPKPSELLFWPLLLPSLPPFIRLEHSYSCALSFPRLDSRFWTHHVHIHSIEPVMSLSLFPLFFFLLLAEHFGRGLQRDNSSHLQLKSSFCVVYWRVVFCFFSVGTLMETTSSLPLFPSFNLKLVLILPLDVTDTNKVAECSERIETKWYFGRTFCFFSQFQFLFYNFVTLIWSHLRKE